MKTIYIGKENGQETVVEVTMEKPDFKGHKEECDCQDCFVMNIYEAKYIKHEYHAPRYIVPFPIPDHWKIGEEVEVELKMVKTCESAGDVDWHRIAKFETVATPLPTEVKEEEPFDEDSYRCTCTKQVSDEPLEQIAGNYARCVVHDPNSSKSLIDGIIGRSNNSQKEIWAEALKKILHSAASLPTYFQAKIEEMASQYHITRK